MIAMHGHDTALWWAKRHKETMAGIKDQEEYWGSVIQEIFKRVAE